MLIEFQDVFSTSFGIHMKNFHVFLKLCISKDLCTNSQIQMFHEIIFQYSLFHKAVMIVLLSRRILFIRSFISVKIYPLLKVAYVLGKEIKKIYQGRRPSRSNNKREIKRLCKVACKNSFSVHRHGQQHHIIGNKHASDDTCIH